MCSVIHVLLALRASEGLPVSRDGQLVQLARLRGSSKPPARLLRLLLARLLALHALEDRLDYRHRLVRAERLRKKFSNKKGIIKWKNEPAGKARRGGFE